MDAILPFRAALLEVAQEQAVRATQLEAAALARAGEGRSFDPPMPRVADLILQAQHARQVAEAAVGIADGLRF